MNRRRFLASAIAAGFSDGFDRKVGAGMVRTHNVAGGATRPNILLIIADQLRYPSVFPSSIGDTGTFFSRFMPNVYKLWQSGVKFVNHYTASVPCSPGRAALVTGLYCHQTWLLQNIAEVPYNTTSLQPWLNPGFPTFGKLLQNVGYYTPYAGKWHLAIPPKVPPRLQEYGFEGLTYYDPEGFNLEGTIGNSDKGYLNDRMIADTAIDWLSSARAAQTPWCLTVSLINPHDIEYFWAGTEFKTYDDLFNSQSQYVPFGLYTDDVGSWNSNPLKDPPACGYPELPPNWESAGDIGANKPSTQAYFKLREQLERGGISDDPAHTGFTIAPYGNSGYGVGKAPFGYWQRGLDCYTLLMSLVDGRIGEILNAIPADQIGNTIIVFTSDHGDYAGAHGFVSGKTNTVYDEAYHIPLIVVDPTGQFAGDIDTARTGLTCSVDVLRMLVSFANNGSQSWISGGLAQLYGARHDLMSMLNSATAPGRCHVLLTSDDVAPEGNAYQKLHLVGLRTQDFKLGTYAQWLSGTTLIDPRSLETEFYDYSTAGGRAEINNQPTDPAAATALMALLEDLLPNELEARLPEGYGLAEAAAKQAYLQE